jgi:hypothetical protein
MDTRPFSYFQGFQVNIFPFGGIENTELDPAKSYGSQNMEEATIQTLRT